mgnify:CR=1 FL=1
MRAILRQLFGRFFWLSVGDDTCYKGQWLGNKFHGRGSVRYSNGSVFTGRFVRGARHGFGEYCSSSGYSYRGHWRYGEQTGKAEIRYKNGDKYIGEQKNGVRHGLGTIFVEATSMSFTGTWDNGNLLNTEISVQTPSSKIEGAIDPISGDGSATIAYANGDKYTGDVRAFMRDGSGVLEKSNGTTIRGTWSEETNVTSATMLDENGFCWSGEFRDMKPDGRVIVTTATGLTYESVWADGNMLSSLSKTLPRGMH